ncbi:MAG: hypothetical protein Q4G40_10895 [Brachybacterium sp.]|nr:hypothetical protein [Brachybacterium sp.]
MGFTKTKRAAKKASKRARKDSKRFGKHADSSLKDLQKSADKVMKDASKQAGSGLSKFSSAVGPAVTEGYKEANAKAHELVDHYRPIVEEQVKHGGERLAEFSDKAGPRVEKLRHDLQEDYIPRARRTALATNAVVTSAVTAAVDAARKEFEKGEGDIRAAVTQSQKPKKRRAAGSTLLVLGLIGLGAAAGYVVWKRTRPVEDPWAPPADFARAHYPASASTDSDSSQVSDAVGGAEAGDVAQSLKGGGDRPSDTEPKNVKVDSAEGKDAQTGTDRLPGSSSTGPRPGGTDSEASGESRSTGKRAARVEGRDESDPNFQEEGRIIDPVENPEENPQDPEGRGPGGNHNDGATAADEHAKDRKDS